MPPRHSVSIHARSAVTTVRVNEEQGYIEIRTEPKAADRIAKTFAQANLQQVTIGVKPIMSRYGYDIEEIADALGGELVDAVGKPQLYLNEIHSKPCYFGNAHSCGLGRTIPVSYFLEIMIQLSRKEAHTRGVIFGGNVAGAA